MVSGQKSKDSTSEERLAASNYIISFYNQVAQLTSFSAQYFNHIVLLNEKYQSDATILDENDKQELSNYLQNIRYNVQMSYIILKCISEKIELKKVSMEDIEKNYKEIKENFVIPTDKLEKFVILLNSLLVSNVMKNLLETSQSLVDRFVGGGTSDK